jgi:N-acyl homoserine lactone hydrolase
VLVRNDGKRATADGWILAGDLIYQFENLVGTEEGDECYLPIGLATGSQTNLLLTTHEMMSKVGSEAKRVIPIHEERLKDRFPSRLTPEGLHLIEVTLGKDEPSRVS